MTSPISPPSPVTHELPPCPESPLYKAMPFERSDSLDSFESLYSDAELRRSKSDSCLLLSSQLSPYYSSKEAKCQTPALAATSPVPSNSHQPPEQHHSSTRGAPASFSDLKSFLNPAPTCSQQPESQPSTHVSTQAAPASFRDLKGFLSAEMGTRGQARHPVPALLNRPRQLSLRVPNFRAFINPSRYAYPAQSSLLTSGPASRGGATFRLQLIGCPSVNAHLPWENRMVEVRLIWERGAAETGHELVMAYSLTLTSTDSRQRDLPGQGRHLQRDCTGVVLDGRKTWDVNFVLVEVGGGIEPYFPLQYFIFFQYLLDPDNGIVSDSDTLDIFVTLNRVYVSPHGLASQTPSMPQQQPLALAMYHHAFPEITNTGQLSCTIPARYLRQTNRKRKKSMDKRKA